MLSTDEKTGRVEFLFATEKLGLITMSLSNSDEAPFEFKVREKINLQEEFGAIYSVRKALIKGVVLLFCYKFEKKAILYDIFTKKVL